MKILLLLASLAYSQETVEVRNAPGETIRVEFTTPTIQGITDPVTVVPLGSFTISAGTSALTTQGNFSTFTVSVAVTGGTGEVVFTATGTVKSCGLIPPVGATYDFEVVTDDANQFPAFGKDAITGRAGINGDWAVLGQHRFRFSNATLDGTYKARCLLIR